MCDHIYMCFLIVKFQQGCCHPETPCFRVVSIHHFKARACKKIRDDVKKYRIPRALGRKECCAVNEN